MRIHASIITFFVLSASFACHAQALKDLNVQQSFDVRQVFPDAVPITGVRGSYFLPPPNTFDRWISRCGIAALCVPQFVLDPKPKIIEAPIAHETAPQSNRGQRICPPNALCVFDIYSSKENDNEPKTSDTSPKEPSDAQSDKKYADCAAAAENCVSDGKSPASACAARLYKCVK